MRLRFLGLCLAVGALVGVVLTNPMRNVSATTGQIEEARTSTGCHTSGGWTTTCSVSLTWPIAFADTNYTVVCTPENTSIQYPNPYQDPTWVYVLPASKRTTGVSVTIGDAGTGSIPAYLNGVGCIAVHD